MNKHTVTLPNGATATRNSKTRRYDYALLVTLTEQGAEAKVAECRAHLESWIARQKEGDVYLGDGGLERMVQRAQDTLARWGEKRLATVKAGGWAGRCPVLAQRPRCPQRAEQLCKGPRRYLGHAAGAP